jgi:nucleotide-binding universal stress UspA family protein
MKEFSTVVVPHDFSPQADRALQYAIKFFYGQAGKNIYILHVLKESASRAAEKTALERIQAIIDNYHGKTSAHLHAKIARGVIPDTILAVQQELKSDAIIMGTRRSMQANDDEATHTASLVYDAECPVIVIPDTVEKFKLKKMVLLVGKEDLLEPEKLSVALVVARQFNAEIHVLTFYDEDDKDLAGQDVNEDNLAYYFDRFYTQHIFVKSDDLLEGITKYLDNHDIDLFAIIPNNHARQGKASEGRLTRLLTLQAKIPLLTIDKVNAFTNA